MKKFFIFTRGRTGSTAIIDELNSHPDCICHGEIFRHDPLSRPKFRLPYEARGQAYLRELLDSDEAIPYGLWVLVDDGKDKSLASYLRLLEEKASSVGANALGFKLLHNHATEQEGILGLLRDANYKAIHLIRKNVVRQVVSGLLARARGVYNSRKPNLETTAYPIDVRELKSRIENNLAQVALASKKLKELGFDATDVFYEDFVEDRLLFHEKLASAIGISSAAVESTSYKVMVPDDLSAAILNYEEFVAQVNSMGLGDLIK